MAANLPSGTVTFLFTDIEGSTRIAQEHADTWEALRRTHHTLLHKAIEAHNGHVFQVVGDAFCTAFHRPGEALRAALDAQRSLQAQAADEPALRVRMGLHTGEAETDGAGYSGYLTLSSAQRVMSAGHGGQVLLSQATCDLVQNELPEGVTLRDMGEHRLKDLARPQHLYQVVVADLPSDFPPLRSLNARLHNLPIQLTSFIGRERERRELGELLVQKRLITLTGVGGTGKTRLALQVVAENVDAFADGTWLVELAALADPAVVPQAIASVFKVREEPGRPVLETLKDYLNNKHMLLVLDNCEHLIEACASVVHELLQAAPHIRVLATSRELLGISGECGFPVRSLSLPAPSAASADEILPFDAVRLFTDRAMAAQPEFQLADHNAHAVLRICSRLDGIPLAIELAAARANSLGIEQIAARLDDRFHLLTGGSRTALPRQRTLQATIDWSYRLLSEEERVMLRRLSVFAGGWDLEAAESVCPGTVIQANEVLDLLTHLVEKSLVLASEQSGAMRYRILETIRQFAQEKLDESEEAQAVRARHHQYYSDLVLQFQQGAQTGDHVKWIERIRAERDNYRAALDWALATRQPKLAFEMSSRLGWYGTYFFEAREARNWVERILAAVPEPSADRAKLIGRLGVVVMSQGEYAHARELFEEALAISEALEDRHLTGLSSYLLSTALYALGEEQKALQLEERGLELLQGGGHPEDEGLVLLSVADRARAKGDYARAVELSEKSLQLFRRANDKNRIHLALWSLGELSVRLNDLDKGSAYLRHGLLAATANAPALPSLLTGFSLLANARGQAIRAAKLISAAIAVQEAEGRVFDARERSDQEKLLASLQSQLDEAAFQEACKAGSAMTREQAAAYALEEPRT